MIRLGTIGAFGFDDFDPPEILGLYQQLGVTVVQGYRRRESAITPDHIRRSLSRIRRLKDRLEN